MSDSTKEIRKKRKREIKRGIIIDCAEEVFTRSYFR